MGIREKLVISNDGNKILSSALYPILENVSDAAVVIDLNGNIVLWSGQAEKIFGWNRSEAVDQVMTNLILTQISAQIIDKKIKQYSNSHNDPGDLIELSGITKEKKEIRIELKVHSLVDSGQQYFYALIRDISERIAVYDQLNEQKEFYQRILENIPTDIAIFDENHRYVYVNPYGIKDPELRKYIIGKDDFDYLKYRGRDPAIANMRREKFSEAKSTGQIVVWEDSTTDPHGEIQTSLRKFYPVYDQDKRFSLMIGFGIDITARKKMEEYIQNINQDLEFKIEERTNELQRTNEELNTFNSMVSHDLQSPLRAMSGFSKILRDDYAETLDNSGKELLALIERNARHMSSLIRGLLKFSQLGKAPLAKVWTDMNEIVGTVVDDIQMVSVNSNTQITQHELPPASCDMLLIKQVWFNLIGNAVKYSSKKENPKIEIGGSQTDQGTVYYVHDNGAGFDIAYANKLFQIFERLHSQVDFEGTGVGLAIVHRIISKHGGKIWAESKVGEGSTFHFTLATE